jgi:DNA mismatch repair ATPase MutS
LAGACDSMDELANLLESALEPDCPPHLRDGGFIRNGFSAELDRLRSISTDGQSWLRNYQKEQSQRTPRPTKSQRITSASRPSRTPSGTSPRSSRTTRTKC